MPKRKTTRSSGRSLIRSRSPSPDSSEASSPSSPPARPIVHHIIGGKKRPQRSASAGARHIIIGGTDSDSSSSTDDPDAESDEDAKLGPLAAATSTGRRSLSKRASGSTTASKKQNGTGSASTTPKGKNKRARIQKSPAETIPLVKTKTSPASRSIMDYFNKIPKATKSELEEHDVEEVAVETKSERTKRMSVEVIEGPYPVKNPELPRPVTNGHCDSVEEEHEAKLTQAEPEADDVAVSDSKEVADVLNGIVIEVVDSEDSKSPFDSSSSPQEDDKSASSPSESDVIECSPAPESSPPVTKRKTTNTNTDADTVSVPEKEPEEDSGRRRSSRIAKMQRNIKSYFISDKPDSPSSPETSPEPKSKRKSKVKCGNSNAKGRKSAANSSSSQQSSQSPSSPVAPPKRVMDAQTRDFLYSGLPSTILKAQRQAEKKREQDSWLEVARFFPRISHVNRFEEDDSVAQSLAAIPFKFKSGTEEIEGVINIAALAGFLNGFMNSECKHDPKSLPNELSCCPIANNLEPSSSFISFLSNIDSTGQDPFVLKHAPMEDLSLATDSSAVQKFSNWLETWKADITESGGTTRRQLPEPKRRPRDSDSDFVASDEDESGLSSSERKKSVLIYGPSGCGKSAMIYTIAESLGFKVVEINFSSRRSGREVIEMVEEATLSRRLHEKGNGNGDGENSEEESSSSEESEDEEEKEEDSQGSGGSGPAQDPRPCLLLFEDVNLLHEEQDDGFHRAVVQLIQSSVRPIIMTISTSVQNEDYIRATGAIDPKIDKTEPLWIQCQQLPSEAIVKALTRIIRAEFEGEDEYVQAVLATIAQHTEGDVRRAVNQLQYYLSPDWFPFYEKLHADLCSASGDGGIVHDFKQQASASACKFHPDGESSADKVQNIRNLDKIAKGCAMLAESDLISTAEGRLENEYGWQQRIQHDATQNFVRFGQVKASTIPLQYYAPLLYEPAPRQLSLTTTRSVHRQLMEYMDEGFGRAYETDVHGWLRTIVKQCILNSLGDSGGSGAAGRSSTSRRRHGRVKHYFNRMSQELIGEIEETLDFKSVKNEVQKLLESSSLI